MKKEKRFKLRVAVYLILIKDGQVLLSRRYQTGWRDGDYSLVSGHINGGEPATIAMIREAKEEVGIQVRQNDLKPVTVIHRHDTHQEYIDIFFSCERWQGTPVNQELDKCDELKWVPLSALPDKLTPNVRQALSNFQHQVMFSEFGWK